MKDRCNKSTYKVGDKLISEIASVKDDYAIMTDGRCLSNAEMDKLGKLDSDYINDYFGELQDEAYNKGLEDAWKLVRTANDYYSTLTVEELGEHFGTSDFNDFIWGNSPLEVSAKLKAYEEEQSKIEVGDIVEINGEKAVVSSFGTDNDMIHVMYFEGIVNSYKKDVDCIKKTGKHINLEQILKEIGE